MTITIDFTVKRATAAKWKSMNPTLKSGQLGWEKDTGQVKIGDGVTAWSNLPYCIFKNNLEATRDPASGDYSGYSPGSMWFNHTNGCFWVCKSISGTVAVWTCMAAGAGN